MKSKMLVQAMPEKSWAIIFEPGEEAMSSLLSFASEHSITAAHFTAIGVSRAVLGYFDWETKKYSRIPVDEQVEVVMLAGDIALEKGKPKIHAHAVVAKRGWVTIGGHVLKGHVRPTLEMMLSASKQLERKFDEQRGIALIRIEP